jgi:hypothetical protein
VEPGNADQENAVQKLTIETIDDIVGNVIQERERLDLRRVRFVDPYALLLLDLLVKDREERGTPLCVLWPTDRLVSRWMTRMGLFGELEGEVPTGDGRAPTVAEALQPITRIEEERGITKLVNTFDSRLSARYPIDWSPRKTLIQMMIELFQNIPQHSNATEEVSDPHGVAAMQDYRDGLVLAIADKGIGLRASLSLREVDTDLTDAAALEAAVLRGVSRFADPGRGKELMRIFHMVRSWEGTIVVRSGSALLYHHPDRGSDVFDVAFFAGVQIALCIPRRVFGVGRVDLTGEGVFNEPNE